MRRSLRRSVVYCDRMDPKRFTREQIDSMTYRIASLEQAERDAVRHALYARLRIGDGRIGPQELHVELLKLRKEHKISEFDMKKVEDSFFGDA